MKNNVDIFKPGVAELKKIAQKHAGITINGLDDQDGYQRAKEATKELGRLRIDLKKFGKEKRDYYTKIHRNISRQEKELLKIIVPVEDKIKAQINRIDEERKKEERRILLPTRRALIEALEMTVDDNVLLAMDEKEFATFYEGKKREIEEIKEAEKREKEREERRKQEIKEAQEQAKLRERERLARVEERRKQREKEAEEERKRQEKEERKRIKTNEKYNEFLKKNEADNSSIRLVSNMIPGISSEFFVIQNDNVFTLYKKIDETKI